MDRRTLGLDSLSITDIDIVDLDGVEYIVLTDKASRLIAFRYMEDNTIEDIQVINVEGVPSQFTETV